MARMRHNPCKECEKRMVGCHATCEEYILAKKEHEEAKAEERKRKVIDSYELEMTRKRRKR